MSTDAPIERKDFIRDAVREDLASGRFAPPVMTRFPPEPNGYLHIGHAKAICISFGIARDFQGQTNLRFDDTNPTKEEQEYIDAIREDVTWLGFQWDRECYASDYFQQLYDWARQLIEQGDAYVDEQTAEAMAANRGNVNTPGTPSPYRDRPPAESLDLFERMKHGEFPDGSKVLRAKIDMASPNMNLRDPAMYRILHATHPKTGDAWCIYPMYDYAHGQSDSLESITHSLCSLEFEDHRPLYEWFIEKLGIFPSRQIEFSRLELTHVMTSKRKLLALIEEGHVTGWDDPRLPTLRGLRRRGYTPEALRALVEEVGITKFKGTTDFALLEHHLRQDLNLKAQRRMAVLDPIKVVITNYPEGQVEEFDAINNPEDEADGTRKVPFSRELYIEREDYKPNANRKFYRLTEGREVRLRYAYWIKCEEAITDDDGNVVELRCTYDPETRGGENPPPDAEGKVRKVKGTIHWVSAEHALQIETRLYEHLFATENPNEGSGDDPPRDWRANLNPDSVKVVQGLAEPALADDAAGVPLQFERTAYFVRDSVEDGLVFNRTVTLKGAFKKKG